VDVAEEADSSVLDHRAHVGGGLRDIDEAVLLRMARVNPLSTLLIVALMTVGRGCDPLTVVRFTSDTIAETKLHDTAS